MSTARLRLPRCTRSNGNGLRCAPTSRRRSPSPVTGSTLITSAPRSPRIVVQYGPASAPVISRTRTPCRKAGRGCAVGSLKPSWCWEATCTPPCLDQITDRSDHKEGQYCGAVQLSTLGFVPCNAPSLDASTRSYTSIGGCPGPPDGPRARDATPSRLDPGECRTGPQ